MSRVIDLTGKVFGKWTVLQRDNNYSNGGSRWEVECTCGMVKTVHGGSLRTGGSKGCRSCKETNNHLRPYEALYLWLVRKSKHKVLLTYKQFLRFTKINNCHYCAAPVSWSEFNLSKNSVRYNLDRKNNTLGYTNKNCVVCCRRCNYGKGKVFSYKEWKEIGKTIKRLNAKLIH
jgi:hypothetical protein